MWKLVMAECRYHWTAIGLAYAIILFLAVSHLLFEGATWQIVSTTSSMALIFPASRLGAISTKEKRLRNTLPIPIAIRKIGTARIVSPTIMVAAGLALLWLFILLFSPARITATMIGRTFLLFGFLFLVIAIHAFISDLKHLFAGSLGKLMFSAVMIILYFVLLAMIASVYLLYYRNISEAFGLESFQSSIATSPGVFIFAIVLVAVGIVMSAADLAVLKRRQTFLE